MPTTAMPRTVARHSDRALIATILGASITAAVHFAGWLAWNPTLLLYLAFTSAAAVCGVNSALARCHLAIGQAFMAGVQQGRAPAPRPTDTPKHDTRPTLRAVD